LELNEVPDLDMGAFFAQFLQEGDSHFKIVVIIVSVATNPEEYFVLVDWLIACYTQLHSLVHKDICVIGIELGNTFRLAADVGKSVVFDKPNREAIVAGVCAN
jgi:hypothetical protein